jgi:hypothetical protein
VPGGGEDAHVAAGLGHDHLRGPHPDPGDGADQIGEGAKGLHHHLDPGGQVRDGLTALVNGIEIHSG